MQFFARIVFICNLSFIATVILRLVEINKKSRGDLSPALGFQPLESTLIVLGYTAIFINLIFCLLVFLKFAARKAIPVRRWLVLFNLLMFIFQVYYFFVSTF
jgi:hypothetical protein